MLVVAAIVSHVVEAEMEGKKRGRMKNEREMRAVMIEN